MPDCPVCGSPLPDGARECSECGTLLDGATTPFAPVGSDETAAGSVDEGPALVVVKGPEVGERFYIDREELTLGRDPDCDVFLNDVTVSRRHAVLRVRAGVVSVEDSGSLNGTYVNGVRVDEAPLGAGDRLQVGRFVMTFVVGGAA